MNDDIERRPITLNKYKTHVIHTRNIAIEIIELFENLLDEYDIKIPDEEREGYEDEASIYGMSYALLEDSVNDKLVNLSNNVLEHCNEGLTIDECSVFH